MANGLLDYLSGFGATPPEYLGGLLGQDAVDKLKSRAATTGIANAVLGYLAAPKNQNLGLGRIIGQSLQAGMTGAQGVYDTALQDWQTKQKIDEMNRQKAQRDAFDVAAKGLYTTTPAQYTTEQVSGGGYLPQTPDANALVPNFNLSKTYAPATTQQVMTKPAKQEMSQEALNAMLLSGDPRAASYLSGLKTISEIEAEKRKAPDSPFGKVDPSKFTPNSILRFSTTGRYEDLVPITPSESKFKVGDTRSIPRGNQTVTEQYGADGIWREYATSPKWQPEKPEKPDPWSPRLPTQLTPLQATDKNGVVYNFKSKAAADAFKKDMENR